MCIDSMWEKCVCTEAIGEVNVMVNTAWLYENCG